jgi:hypothetical protein
MDFDKFLRHMRFEYHGWLEAEYREAEQHGLPIPEAPSFYDYLQMRGLSRFQLSAHGIGRDVQP